MKEMNYMIYREWWECLAELEDAQLGRAIRAIKSIYDGKAPDEIDLTFLSATDQRAMRMILAQVARSVKTFERKSRAAESGAGA